MGAIRSNTTHSQEVWNRKHAFKSKVGARKNGDELPHVLGHLASMIVTSRVPEAFFILRQENNLLQESIHILLERNIHALVSTKVFLMLGSKVEDQSKTSLGTWKICVSKCTTTLNWKRQFSWRYSLGENEKECILSLTHVGLILQETSCEQERTQGKQHLWCSLDNFVPIVRRYLHVTRPPSRLGQPMGVRCACHYHVVLRQHCC